jgi:hypothetical protein
LLNRAGVKEAEGKLYDFRKILAKKFPRSGGENPSEEAKGDPGESLLNTKGAEFVDFVSTQPGAALILSNVPRFAFVLKNVEEMPGFGLLISAAMETTLAVMTTGGEMIQNIGVMVPGVGPPIVAVFGLFFWPLLAMVSLSREDFSQASELFLKAIPFGIGKTMANAFAKGDMFFTKFGNKFGNIQEQANAAFALLKQKRAEFEENNREAINHARSRVDAATTGLLNKAESGVERLEESPIGQKIKSAKETIHREISQLKEARQNDLSRPKPIMPEKKPYVPGQFSAPPSGGSCLGNMFGSMKRGGTRKRLSTKKQGKKNKKWKRTRRIKSVRR